MPKKMFSGSLGFVALYGVIARGLAFIVFALATSTTFFLSAARAAEPTPAELYGVWRLEEASGLICNLEFRKDGIFVSDVSRKGKPIGDFMGQWSLKNDTISYVYTKSNVKQIPVGAKDEDRIVEVTAEHIDLQSGKGAVKRYNRVLPK